MAIETVEDAIEALHKLGGREACGYVINRLKIEASSGNFTPLLGERVVEIADRVNFISAQRLMENWSYKKDDPRFDFNQYSLLYLLSLKRLGLKAGSFFGRNYERIVELDIDPQFYYQQIETAVETGGRIFAGYMAANLPEVMEVGGNIQEFQSYSTYIRRIGGIKVAHCFMRNGAKMFTIKQPPFNEFAETSIKCIEEFGKEPSFWVIRAMAPLCDQFQYQPQEFFNDCSEIHNHPALSTEKKRGKAVGWFAYGGSTLAKLKDNLEKSLTKEAEELSRLDERWRKFSVDQAQARDKAQKLNGAQKENYLQAVADYEAQTQVIRKLDTLLQDGYRQKITNYETQLSFLDLPAFIRGYKELIESSSSVAFVYSILTNSPLVGTSEFASLPEDLIRFHKQASKRVLSQAMWFVPKMTKYEGSISNLLEEIIDNQNTCGDEETIKAIRYTWGCHQRGTFTDGLIFPQAPIKHTVTLTQNDDYWGGWEYKEPAITPDIREEEEAETEYVALLEKIFGNQHDYKEEETYDKQTPF